MITRSAKRLFTFGCSFTKYHWACWPEIVAEELDIPFYNYGQSGAGNQFIANTIAQANKTHEFNDDDLIMVSWTNVCREDKWKSGKWATPGNIYTQNIYNMDYVEKWADPLGYLIRDCAIISMTKGFLKNLKCQYHFFSMCDLSYTFDQGGANNLIDENFKNIYQEICKLYNEELQIPNFYNLLWHNDIQKYKFSSQKEMFKNYFSDGHPDPTDHLIFLQRLFPNHEFKKSTLTKVQSATEKLNDFILKQIEVRKKSFSIYELDHEKLQKLSIDSQIKKSETVIIL